MVARGFLMLSIMHCEMEMPLFRRTNLDTAACTCSFDACTVRKNKQLKTGHYLCKTSSSIHTKLRHPLMQHADMPKPKLEFSKKGPGSRLQKYSNHRLHLAELKLLGELSDLATGMSVAMLISESACCIQVTC